MKLFWFVKSFIWIFFLFFFLFAPTKLKSVFFAISSVMDVWDMSLNLACEWIRLFVNNVPENVRVKQGPRANGRWKERHRQRMFKFWMMVHRRLAIESVQTGAFHAIDPIRVRKAIWMIRLSNFHGCKILCRIRSTELHKPMPVRMTRSRVQFNCVPTRTMPH